MNGRVIPVTIFFLALCFHMLDTHDRPSSTHRRRRCGNCVFGKKKERELVKHITKKLDRKYKKTLETFKRDIDKLKNDTKKAIGRLERERSCPVGFLRYKHHCFQFVMSQTMWRKWQDARDYCQGASANLLYLNSTKKHEFIAKYLRENFAGLNDSEVFTSGIYSDTTFIPQQWNPKQEVNPMSLEWFWEGKRSPVGKDISVLHWHNNVIPKPRHLTALKSCLLLSSSRMWRWIDGKCGKERPFICEMKLTKAMLLP